MKDRIQAEITISLTRHMEKTEEYEAFDRFYRFSMPVGAPFTEALIYAQEMKTQIEAMQSKAKKLEDENKKKAEEVEQKTETEKEKE